MAASLPGLPLRLPADLLWELVFVSTFPRLRCGYWRTPSESQLHPRILTSALVNVVPSTFHTYKCVTKAVSLRYQCTTIGIPAPNWLISATLRMFRVAPTTNPSREIPYPFAARLIPEILPKLEIG